MAKRKKTADTSDDSGAPALAEAMLAMNPMAPKAWVDIMSESTRFMMQRLQQDLETQQKMLAARTPMELMELQTAFIQTAMAQYSEEAARLWSAMSKATESGLEAARKGQARGYDDVPL